MVWHKMEKLWLARQGDLLIQRIEELPSLLNLDKTNILAEGEKTGHKHELLGKSRVYRQQNGFVYFEVVEEIVKLVHQEHKTIQIPKGKYIVKQEREFNPFEMRRQMVKD